MNQDENNLPSAADATGGGSGLELNLLRAVLNQVDYGLAVIVADTHQVLFANSPALAALHPDNPQKTSLCVTRGLLCVRHPADSEQFNLALQRTKVGQRGLLHLGGPARQASCDAAPGADASVAVMPLSTPGYALLAFAKPQMCDTTTVTLFARDRGLTNAEGQVLAQICKGLRPQQIATRQGVQVSTVRTQLRAIRHKTASDSVRELVEKVSVLPSISLNIALNLPQFMGGMAAHNGEALVLA